MRNTWELIACALLAFFIAGFSVVLLDRAAHRVNTTQQEGP